MTIPVLSSGTLRKYGITQSQYEYMFTRYGNKCWVCKKAPKKIRLNIDHDHKDGRVRGLLCFRCNKYIVGRHRTGTLLRAAAYYVDSGFDARHIVKVAP